MAVLADLDRAVAAGEHAVLEPCAAALLEAAREFARRPVDAAHLREALDHALFEAAEAAERARIDALPWYMRGVHA